MSIAIVTGSAGLVGASAVALFAGKGLEVIGIDNDMRKVFFGAEASTAWNRDHLIRSISGYRHYDLDIRDVAGIGEVFARFGKDISIILHAAAQPSHDWAARDPVTDFTVNSNGTLVLLEAMRRHCPEAVFLYMSTNKVYGDTPNRLPLIEEATRWSVASGHPYARHGIDESMSIDNSVHSLFGVSKAAADLLVQEYGRNFGFRTACFRGGCLTGPAHSGAQLHGFLAYLARCAVTGTPYTIFGYKGKQVRDQIHSHDVINAFWNFAQNPRPGEVYNLGGGKANAASVLECISMIEARSGTRPQLTYSDTNRIGDHICYYSDLRKLESHYPNWKLQYSLDEIVDEMVSAIKARQTA